MQSTLTRSIRLLFVSLLTLIIVGCASGGGKKPSDSNPSSGSLLNDGKTIQSIAVSYDEANLKPEVLSALKQFSVDRKLDTQIRNASKAIADSGTLTVKAVVTDMRLRSTHSAIWLGSMAGADWIAVSVEIFENGQPVKSFDTSTSTIYGGFAYAGRERRIDRMTLDLGKKVAKGI